MEYKIFLRSPKKEEQEVPATAAGDWEIDIMDELEGFLGIENEEKLLGGNGGGHLSWEFMDWEGFNNAEEEEEEEDPEEEEEEEEEEERVRRKRFPVKEESQYKSRSVSKKENLNTLWDEDENRVSLNLNLNYQEVLDAWSDRGPLWADDYSLSMAAATAGYYMGEVPVMEKERTRREASVLRYKEKRQTRLFSKKIRYQVRKLNADKRPRLKGRFVKRVCQS
ncbi:hypothetical protein SLA2020_521450 [Shorea laevis]